MTNILLVKHHSFPCVSARAQVCVRCVFVGVWNSHSQSWTHDKETPLRSFGCTVISVTPWVVFIPLIIDNLYTSPFSTLCVFLLRAMLTLTTCSKPTCHYSMLLWNAAQMPLRCDSPLPQARPHKRCLHWQRDGPRCCCRVSFPLTYSNSPHDQRPPPWAIMRTCCMRDSRTKPRSCKHLKLQSAEKFAPGRQALWRKEWKVRSTWPPATELVMSQNFKSRFSDEQFLYFFFFFSLHFL